MCALGSFTTIIGMTLILPILPLYVRDLGVGDPAAVTLWSGIAYAATFLTAALTAPLWGYLGDHFGRKPMLIRASLVMAIAMSLIGVAQDVTQLGLLRLLVGLLGGYASGPTILVAAQTPKGRSAWALGTLSSAIMAGTIAGPLIGGTLAQTIGIQGRSSQPANQHARLAVEWAGQGFGVALDCVGTANLGPHRESQLAGNSLVLPRMGEIRRV